MTKLDNLNKMLKDFSIPRTRLIGWAQKELDSLKLNKSVALKNANRFLPPINTDLKFFDYLYMSKPNRQYIELTYFRRLLLLSRYWNKWYNIDLQKNIPYTDKLLQQIKQVSIKLNSIIREKKSIRVKYFLKIMNKLRYYNIISQSRLEYILTYLQTFYPIF